jgi:hypothetical protein
MNNQHPSIDDLFDHLIHPIEDVAAHVVDCRVCRQELALLADVSDALREMEPPPLDPADADDMISAALAVFDAQVEQIHAATPAPATRRPEVSPVPANRRWGVAIGVFAAVAAAALGWIVGAETGTSVDSAESTVALAAVRDVTQDHWMDVGEGERLHLAGSGQRLEIGESLAIENVGPARIRMNRTRDLDKEIEVLSGTIVIEASNRAQDERIAILTPRGEVVVTGTVFFVEVDGSTVEVGVRQGSTRFEHGGQGDALVAGQALVVTASGALNRRELSAAEGEACDRATREHPLPVVAAVRASVDVTPRSAPVDRKVADAPVARPVQVEATVPAGTGEAAPVAGSGRSPAELLAAALDAQRSASRASSGSERERWSTERVRLLEALIREHPTSNEGRAALLRLASAHEAAGRGAAAAANYRAYLALGETAPLHADALAGLCRLDTTDSLCGR